MSSDAAIVFGILGVAGVLFASGRVRLDVTALLVVLALSLSGILTPREALAGFGDPVVILVAGLLVVGEMLSRTGVAFAMGRWLMRAGGASETRLLVMLMLAAGLLGSVMSSTAVVAVFIPVAITISAKTDLNAPHLLMPLSFAALVSGMLTLIATTPNLVVSGYLADKGLEPFGFFSFTPIGLAVLVMAVVYMVVVGRHLLPGDEVAPPKSEARTLEDLWTGFGLEGRMHRLRVPGSSPLHGRTLAEAQIGTRFHARVFGIERVARLAGRELLPSAGADAEIHEGDVLWASSRTESEAVIWSSGSGSSAWRSCSSIRSRGWWETHCGSPRFAPAMRCTFSASAGEVTPFPPSPTSRSRSVTPSWFTEAGTR
jgi:di/tricarboxylate transporter